MSGAVIASVLTHLNFLLPASFACKYGQSPPSVDSCAQGCFADSDSHPPSANGLAVVQLDPDSFKSDVGGFRLYIVVIRLFNGSISETRIRTFCAATNWYQ